MTLHFKHQTIDGREVLDYINQKSGYNFDDFYQQYLYTPRLPELEYKLVGWGKKKILKYRWNAIENFDMPIKVSLKKDQWDWIYPTSQWQEIDASIWQKDFKVAKHLFLVEVKNLK